jgi:hypothetical protein
MPSEGNSVDMIAEVRRQFYKAGWIEDSFNRVCRNLGVDLNELYSDNATQVDGALTKLSTFMLDRDQVARLIQEDANDYVQLLATSDKAYQQWRVNPVVSSGKVAERNGDAFILELADADTKIPSGDLLDSTGKVGGYNEVEPSLTYLGADSRVLSTGIEKDTRFEGIESNPYHPLDFIGVRVELSRPFSSDSLKKEAAVEEPQSQEIRTEPVVPEA